MILLGLAIPIYMENFPILFYLLSCPISSYFANEDVANRVFLPLTGELISSSCLEELGRASYSKSLISHSGAAEFAKRFRVRNQTFFLKGSIELSNAFSGHHVDFGWI